MSILHEKWIIADGTHPHSNKVSSGLKIVLGGVVTVKIKSSVYKLFLIKYIVLLKLIVDYIIQLPLTQTKV